MTFTLDPQVADLTVIIGAAGGVGSVVVDRFIRNNDTVFALDTRKDVLDTWRTRWPTDAKIVTAAADVSDEADSDCIAQSVRDTAGHLDVLINYAGYFPIVGFEEMIAQQWRQVVDTNLTGTFLMSHALLPLLKLRQPAGSSTSVRGRPSPALPGRPTTSRRKPASSASPAASPAKSATTASRSTASLPA